ncbi:MAG TPA: hypothetical protein VGI81_28585 [Tepidisphaeraceae bacterium]|jgi:hypothetical protein
MASRFKRGIGATIGYLAAGLVLTIVVALVCGAAIDLSTGTSVSASNGSWSVTVQSRPGAVRVTSQWQALPWSPVQAAGPPDTPRPGDFPTAWAPATRNGSPEWLLLTYDKPLRIRAVDVYESLSPGALTQISFVTEGGAEIAAWSGVDPTPATAASGVSHVAITEPSLPAVRKIKLDIGIPTIPGWNEIDAVGVIDDIGQTHWATMAEASSFYGQTGAGPAGGSPGRLVPPWAGADFGPPDWTAEGAKSAVRAADARGWPMVALWTPVDGPAVAPGATTVTFLTYPASVPRPVATRNGVLPWRPMWTGLAVDTAAFAATLAVLRMMLTKPSRFVVELSRLKRGCCVRCGYDLNFDFKDGCPECGWRRGA